MALEGHITFAIDVRVGCVSCVNGPLHLPAPSMESPDHLRLSVLRVFDQEVTVALTYLQVTFVQYNTIIIQIDVPRENGGIFEP